MALQFPSGRSATRLLLTPAFLLTLHVQASELLPARLYDVTIETGMPHLEENLRYTTTHQQSCISLKDLATEFPIRLGTRRLVYWRDPCRWKFRRYRH